MTLEQELESLKELNRVLEAQLNGHKAALTGRPQGGIIYTENPIRLIVLLKKAEAERDQLAAELSAHTEATRKAVAFIASNDIRLVDRLTAERDRYREALEGIKIHVAGDCHCFGVLPCLATIGAEARSALACPTDEKVKP